MTTKHEPSMTYVKPAGLEYKKNRMTELLNKLEQISQLEDGWLGENSVAPSTQTIKNVRDYLTVQATFPIPVSLGIAPVGDGTIMVDANQNGTEYTILFEEDKVTLISDNVELNEVLETEMEYKNNHYLNIPFRCALFFVNAELKRETDKNLNINNVD